MRTRSSQSWVVRRGAEPSRDAAIFIARAYDSLLALVCRMDQANSYLATPVPQGLEQAAECAKDFNHSNESPS